MQTRLRVVHRWPRSVGRIRGSLAYALGAMLVTAISIAVALWVTPMQQVSAAGQTIKVGVAAPSLDLSGPGELDLFGQQIDTTTQFAGPVRPRLQLTHITLSQQLSQLSDHDSGSAAAKSLQHALVRGFRHYVYWQAVVVALVAVLLTGAVSGWLRHDRRKTIWLIAAGLAVAEAVNLGCIMVTAYSAPAKLSQVHSLQSLVGDAPTLHLPADEPTPNQSGSIVVIGDSTAAAIGNRPVERPTSRDAACQRSRDSYAVALGRVSGLPVTNLACSGATIPNGLLGAQHAGDTTIPAQVVDPAVGRASTVIVSVGANDVRWSDLLRICAISASCSNNAEVAVFQQYLAHLSSSYLQLLSVLKSLPQHPHVIINLYYDPFGNDVGCLNSLDVGADKRDAMLSRLTALNQVLSEGAKAADFTTARPNFDGHGLCSKVPYVQDIKASAPFHPTAAGELAIALADLHASHVR